MFVMFILKLCVTE